MGQFDGQVIYITGIARGQGRNHALRFAAEGATIVGMDIAGPVITDAGYPPATPDDLAEAVSLVEEAGGKILARQGDIRDLAAQQALVAEAVEQFGRLDHVIANAGVLGWGPVWELIERQFSDVIEVNLIGTWKTLRATIPTLMEGDCAGRSIVIISSVAGIKAMPHQAAYTASKFGLRGLAQSTAKELAPQRIRVNSVHPYAVDTPMGVADVNAMTVFTEKEQYLRHFVSMMDHYPVASLDDISDAVLYLASDHARAVTGAEFQVDMGHSKV